MARSDIPVRIAWSREVKPHWFSAIAAQAVSPAPIAYPLATASS